jgi:hypothetical protein
MAIKHQGTNALPKKDSVTSIPRTPTLQNLASEPIVNKEDSLSEPDLKSMLLDFMRTSREQQEQNQRDINLLRLSVTNFTTSAASQVQGFDSPVIDRSQEDRRSSMFFGSPLPSHADHQQRTTIQVLQNDIVYNNLLRVISLDGLQFMSKRIAELTNDYPGREIKTSHMVSMNLRPHIIASWTEHVYESFLITGISAPEIMLEDWPQLSNEQVHRMLIHSARPRTKEKYAEELIKFLSKGIPQSPVINTENFSRLYFAPLMKSLNDLLHLYELLSEESTNHSNNKAKMPSQSFGSMDNPGQILCWLISLGVHCNAIQQWLGKDDLMKHKTLLLSVKFIRGKLLEGRSQSLSFQDLDSKLTPIRFDNFRQTPGESFQRLQSSFPPQPTPSGFVKPRDYHGSTNNFKPKESSQYRSTSSHDVSSRRSLSSLDILTPNDTTTDDFLDHDLDEISSQHSDASEVIHDLDSNLSAVLTNSRGAIAATFKGYCCDLFVFGKCPRLKDGCTFDHSAAGQEICQKSFTLLASRQLDLHSALPRSVNSGDRYDSNVKSTNITRYPSASRQPSSTHTLRSQNF